MYVGPYGLNIYAIIAISYGILYFFHVFLRPMRRKLYVFHGFLRPVLRKPCVAAYGLLCFYLFWRIRLMDISA